MCFKNVDKGKGKGIDDVEKVITSLPFLKTSTKGKKAAQGTFFCFYVSEVIECIRQCFVQNT